MVVLLQGLPFQTEEQILETHPWVGLYRSLTLSSSDGALRSSSHFIVWAERKIS